MLQFNNLKTRIAMNAKILEISESDLLVAARTPCRFPQLYVLMFRRK